MFQIPSALGRAMKVFFKGATLAVAATLLFSAPALAQEKPAKQKQTTKQNTKQAPKKNAKQGAGQQAPDPTVIFANQPAFTENELTQFIEDYTKIRGMKTEQEAVEYLVGRGWTGERFTYVAAKTALTRDVLRHGATNEILQKLPKDARPQKGELELVKKYQNKIDAMPGAPKGK